MNLTVAYSVLFMGVVVWFLLVRKLTAKSWETQLVAGDVDLAGATHLPPAKVGLWIFLAVATSLFGLFISAYHMRMGHGPVAAGDWQPFPQPPILWLNSVVLILSSVAMQWARAAATHGRAERTELALNVAGLLTIAFLIGQILAWRHLIRSGYFVPHNPALAFFYVLTFVHALHLLGGLYVWGRTLTRLRQKGREIIDVRLSVELCSVYWHYLLIVWLVLFALLLTSSIDHQRMLEGLC